MAERFKFSKMHGAGNDFVVLDLRNGQGPPDAATYRLLADRHFGVGCDQILTIEAPRHTTSVASYRIWNADGSSAQQCGNGARCIAAWLVRDGVAAHDDFNVDSPTGTHAVQVTDDDCFAIAMGVPEFEPIKIPLHGFDIAQDVYALVIDEVTAKFGAVSMGNPHALIEVDDIAQAPLRTLGPALQTNPAFPQSVNVGFAEIVSRDHIKLRVYERGVGETLACGSGACAAAAILIRRGRIDRNVRIELPGGTLQIHWPSDNASITMTGSATFVFEGEWNA